MRRSVTPSKTVYNRQWQLRPCSPWPAAIRRQNYYLIHEGPGVGKRVPKGQKMSLRNHGGAHRMLAR